jgi:hypothetical protein
MRAPRARRLVGLLLLVAAALAPAATAGTPPGLGGEQLTAASTTIQSCTVGDAGGTFAYTVSGTATGPYPGTFTESGTATVGPLDPTFRHRVLALSGSFTIDSPTGHVTGSHAFAPTGPELVNVPRGDCSYGWTGVSGSLFVFQNALRYTSTITTPAGLTCTAAGPALLGLVQGSSVLRDSFGETFYNDASAPAPTCAGADATPPTIETPAEVIADATSADGAAVDYAVSASDGVDPSPSLVCEPPSGALFPIGETTVTCTASDAAGNTATATFTVTVRDAADQIADELASGVGGLGAKQRAALADLEAGRTHAACNVLGAYASEVRAQAGKQLSVEEAAGLLETVRRVETLLSC